jgi:hypothetical protein
MGEIRQCPEPGDWDALFGAPSRVNHIHHAREPSCIFSHTILRSLPGSASLLKAAWCASHYESFLEGVMHPAQHWDGLDQTAETASFLES